MPTHKYEGRDNIPVVEAGEYLANVTGFEFKLSKSGNDMLELRLSTEPDGAKLYEYLVFTDSMGWKIDVVLKALGLAPKEGEEIDIDEKFVEDHIMFAQGWVQVVVEEYEGKKRNKIAQWITNKPVPAKAEGTF